MGKIFQTSEDVLKKAEKAFHETALETYGPTIRVMSVTKAKEIIKASRASEATEFLTETQDVIQMFIYEAAFDILDEETQMQLLEMALSVFAFDGDKGKIVIDNRPNASILNMCRKYGCEFVDKLELQNMVIQQVEEEEKAKKEAKKSGNE